MMGQTGKTSARAISTAADSSVAEQMLNLTRSKPWDFQIVEHKDEVRKQILIEAESKKSTLQLKLINLEGKRIKGVNDSLLIREIKNKVQKANELIKKLKFGEAQPKHGEQINLEDFIGKGQSDVASSMGELR